MTTATMGGRTILVSGVAFWTGNNDALVVDNGQGFTLEVRLDLPPPQTGVGGSADALVMRGNLQQVQSGKPLLIAGTLNGTSATVVVESIAGTTRFTYQALR